MRAIWGVVLIVGACSSDSSAPADAAAHSCTDGVRNGDETDVDCGGSCPACATGRACLHRTDCAAGHCVDNVCEGPMPDAPMIDAPAQFGCNGYLTCIVNAQSQSDLDACDARATTNAMALLNALDQCITDQCISVDGGTPACTSPSDNSSMCQMCTQDVLRTCNPDGGDSRCGACKPALDACRADLP